MGWKLRNQRFEITERLFVILCRVLRVRQPEQTRGRIASRRVPLENIQEGQLCRRKIPFAEYSQGVIVITLFRGFRRKVTAIHGDLHGLEFAQTFIQPA